MSAIDKHQMFVQERIERAAALTRSGQSAKKIAVRIGVSERTVTRYRALRRAQLSRKATT